MPKTKTRPEPPPPIPIPTIAPPGEQIRMARLARRMSQAVLAERLGLRSQTQVSRLELGTETPSIDWFLGHLDVWAELGLGPGLFAPLLAETAKAGECPMCRRPL